MSDRSNLLHKGPCDDCGSSDACAVYDDGHTHCFSCRTTKRGDSDGFDIDNNNSTKPRSSSSFILRGVARKIQDRNITEATCRHYGVLQESGKHYYPYTDKHGVTVGCKVREVDTKKFYAEGKLDKALLFGQHLFHGGGKYLTITEGELDALSAYQMMGSKWPVVSLRTGAAGALKDCKSSFEWMDSFETIVVCFDADEPGQRATLEIAELFGNKVKIFKGKHGHKDASDYLVAGDEKAFNDDWWRAEVFVPDGIVNGSDLWEEVSKPEEQAKALYPWEGLNQKLYGLREAELITVTAGSGLGKSQFLREILHHLLKTTDWNIGALFLEESVKKTARSLMSIEANKPLHIPDTPVSDEELKRAFDATLGTGRILLYDHFGSSDVDHLCNRIRYMARAGDCKVIFLDHISIVVSGSDLGDERKVIDNMMTKLRTLVQELRITLICVSHLRRPQGNSGHEDGASVSLSQLRGSGAIAQLSDAVITLERNSMSDDETVRNTTKVAVAKNRYTGYTGPCCELVYSQETGRMTEAHLEVL